MHWPTKEKARQHFSLDQTDGTAPRTEKGIRGRLDRAMPYREHGEGGGGFRETCWPLLAAVERDPLYLFSQM
jgi:hypothetical protein